MRILRLILSGSVQSDLSEAAVCGSDSLSQQWPAHVYAAEWSSSERCPDPAAASEETPAPVNTHKQNINN